MELGLSGLGRKVKETTGGEFRVFRILYYKVYRPSVSLL